MNKVVKSLLMVACVTVIAVSCEKTEQVEQDTETYGFVGSENHSMNAADTRRGVLDPRDSTIDCTSPGTSCDVGEVAGANRVELRAAFESLDLPEDNTGRIKSILNEHGNVNINTQKTLLEAEYLELIISDNQNDVVYGIIMSGDLLIAYSYVD